MRMRDVIAIISVACEAEDTEFRKLKDVQAEIYAAISKIERTGGKEISLYEYNRLIERKEALRQEIEYKSAYINGLFSAISVLSPYGADKIVEE